jgi:hypothetical protein
MVPSLWWSIPTDLSHVNLFPNLLPTQLQTTYSTSEAPFYAHKLRYIRRCVYNR